jgi:DNA-binding response OmpR family regulator
MAERILIVEDEPSVAEAVSYALEQEGFEAHCAADGPRALSRFEETKPDLVILDLMLPGINGWELFGAFRKQNPRVPVIMLTARAEEPDRVAGLEMGADDYITKPFSMRELVARVRAVLRRASGDNEEIPLVLERSGVSLDTEKHEVRVEERVVALSPKEFDLLAYLMRHAGRVRSREDILQSVWGQDAYLDERTVDVHIRWLRTKIEQDPANPQRLLTVRGVGYKYTETQ